MNRNFYQILLSIVLWSGAVFQANAQTYYWVGGTGNWNQLSHWAATSGGPGNAFAQIPQSTNDVVFNGNSGITATTTITLSSATSSNITCRNFTVNTGTAITPRFSGASELDVYGSMDLQAGMNLSLWSGDIYFMATTNQVHQLRNNSLYNLNVSFEPTGASHTVYAYRSIGGTRYLTLRQGAGNRVDFETSFYGSYIVANSGTTNFNVSVAGPLSGRVTNMNVTGGTINVNQPSKFDVIVLNGSATSMAVVNMTGNTHDIVDFEYNNIAGTLDITGSTININQWDVRSSNINLTTTNSVLNFNIGTMGYFQGANEIYNEVNCTIFMWLRAINGFPNGTFNTLRFFKGARVIDGATSYTVNNLLRIESGGLYNATGDRDRYNPSNMNFVVLPAAITQLVGTCTQKLSLRNAQFNFNTGAAAGLQSNHVRMDNVQAIGTEAPYQSGANSYAVPNTGVAGWLAGGATIGLPIARQLRWVPNAAYKSWHNPANWQDIPSGIIGQCPPTLNDYVEFPANSFVQIDSAFAECHNMKWFGTGGLKNINYANDEAVLEVFGSLEWSAPMTLTYNGIIKLRSWDLTQPIVRSNSQKFPYKLCIETTHDSAQYILVDSLQVPLSIAGHYSFILYKGRLHTNGKSVRVGKFTSYRTNLYRQLILGGTNFYCQARYLGGNSSYLFGFEVNNAGSNMNIQADSSTIHILDSLDGSLTRMVVGGGHRFNNVIFYGYNPVLDRGTYAGHTYFRSINFKQGGFYLSTLNSTDTVTLLRTNTVSIVDPFTLSENNGTPDATVNMIVDTAQYYGNTTFTRNINYRKLMFLNAGSSYTINHATLFTQNIVAPLGQLSAIGTCRKNIKITGGNFTSTQTQSGSYLILTNNVASGAAFNYTNSVLTGTVTGWSGVPDIPRKLYWYDGVAGNSKGSWDANQNWSKASGVMLDASGGSNPLVGNCPPTRIDTVIFTNGSFNSIADTVEIAIDPNSAECSDMRWIHDNTIAPVFKADSAERLDLYGSLIFSRTMKQNIKSHVFFLGNPTSRTITSNGQKFNRCVFFNAANATWILQDSFVATTYVANGIPQTTYPYTFNLQQGTFNTNNQVVFVESFGSVTTTPRTLVLGSSQFNVIGTYINGGGSVRYPYEVLNTGFNVNAGTSTIRFTSSYSGNSNLVPYHRMVAGNSTTYYDILFDNTSSLGGVFAATMSARNVTFRGGGYIGTTFSNFVKVTGTSPLLTLPVVVGGINNVIDTMMALGHGEFRVNTRYNKLVQLTPAKNYTFGAGQTQLLANACDFQAIGTGGGGEIFFNSSFTTSQGYIRKDSGRICVDFIYLRDVWAVGNGLSTQSACATAFCDTMQLSSNLPTRATSGRALFQAGSNANDQGNNAGWDFTPYPPIPSFGGAAPLQQLCPGQTFTAVFDITGQRPINLQYSIFRNGVLTTIDTFDIIPLSGSGTALDPYKWGLSVVMDSFIGLVAITPRAVSVDRCFNNTALATGLKSADVTTCLLLPTRFTHAEAQCTNDKINISWDIANPQNVASFVVQRSTDGIHFENLGIVAFAENQYHYQYTDIAPLLGNNYYRIVEYDVNTSFSYSEVMTTSCSNANGQPTVLVFPNPSKSEQLNVQVLGVLGEIDLTIYDGLGRNLYHATHSATIGLIQPKVSLPAGVYHFVVQQNAWRKLIKVVVQ